MIIDNVLVSVGVGQHKGSLDAGASKGNLLTPCMGVNYLCCKVISWCLIGLHVMHVLLLSRMKIVGVDHKLCTLALSHRSDIFRFFARKRSLDTFACWS